MNAYFYELGYERGTKTMKKFNKMFVAGVMAASMVFFAGCGNSADSSEADSENTVLKVGTNAAFAPFEYMDEDGQTPIGFDIDLINAIAEDQGMTVEIQNLEFDGLTMAVQNGSLDAAIAGMTVTPERQEQVDFTDTYYDAGLNVAVAADNDSIQSEADLAGKVVTAQQGTTGADKCNELLEAGIVSDVKILPDINVCMLELANGSVDAVIMDIPVNNKYVEQHPDEAKIAVELEGTESFAIAVAKDNTELLDKLNAGLKDVKENGTYDELIDKYFGGTADSEDTEAANDTETADDTEATE